MNIRKQFIDDIGLTTTDVIAVTISRELKSRLAPVCMSCMWFETDFQHDYILYTYIF